MTNDFFDLKKHVEDHTERCEAYDTMGNQCERSLHHLGLHASRWLVKYWKKDHNGEKVRNPKSGVD